MWFVFALLLSLITFALGATVRALSWRIFALIPAGIAVVVIIALGAALGSLEFVQGRWVPFTFFSATLGLSAMLMGYLTAHSLLQKDSRS